MNAPRTSAGGAFLFLAVLWILLSLLLLGCQSTTWRQKAPWNFPGAEEWNQPLETSWVNAVDTFRRLTAPKGSIYDPVMRTMQPDFGEMLKIMDRESRRGSPPRKAKENASEGILGPRIYEKSSTDTQNSFRGGHR